MNMAQIQAMAKKLQKDMTKEQEEIKITEYVGTSSIVSVTATGDRKIKSVKIKEENLDIEDIEMLEDMIMLAFNDCMKKIDTDTEKRLGKFTNMMPGLF